MNSFYLSQNILEAIGLTVLHTIWIFFILYLILIFIDKMLIFLNLNIHIRYNVKMIGYLLFFGVSVAIFWKLYDPTQNFTQNPLDYKPFQTNSSPTFSQNPISNLKETNDFWNKYFTKEYVGIIWIWGLLAMFFRLVLMYILTSRLYFVGLSALPNEAALKCKNIQKILKINQIVRYRYSNLVHSPITIGFFKPLILFPFQFFNQLDERQAEAILMHELAHIKRLDYLINLLQSLLDALFFYHPIAWMLSKEIRKFREYCCDDIAFNHGISKMEYAYTLTILNINFQSHQNQLVMNANQSSFRDRINFVLYNTTPKNALSPVFFALVLLLSIGFLGYSRTLNDMPLQQEKVVNQQNEILRNEKKIELNTKAKAIKSEKKMKQPIAEIVIGKTDTIDINSSNKIQIPSEYLALTPVIAHVENKNATARITKLSDGLLVDEITSSGYYYLKFLNKKDDIIYEKLLFVNYNYDVKYLDPKPIFNDENRTVFTKDELLKKFEVGLSHKDPSAINHCELVSYSVVFLAVGKDPREILFSQKNNFQPDLKKYLISTLSDGASVLITNIVCKFDSELNYRNLGMLSFKVKEDK